MTGGLLCLEPGPTTTVQDNGRPGFAHQGLAASGAVDPRALRAANRLVGNGAEAAVLELALGGGSFRVLVESARVAVTGARVPLTIDGEPAALDRSHTLRRDQVLRVGPTSEGVWAYLAVAGGIATPPVLGSRSTHLRAGIGGMEGRRLRAGDLLPLPCETAPAGQELQLAAPFPTRDDRAIRVVLGPQEDRFTEGARAAFAAQTFRVAAAFDRMAMRLEGDPLDHVDGYNIVSDAVIPGSVQVPGNGLPIVMLADHQTTGGYPKIATVISADLPVLAQRRPGSPVRFMAISVEAAVQARAAEAARLRQLLAGAVPVRGGGGALTAEHLLAANLVGGVVDARDGS